MAWHENYLCCTGSINYSHYLIYELPNYASLTQRAASPGAVLTIPSDVAIWLGTLVTSVCLTQDNPRESFC